MRHITPIRSRTSRLPGTVVVGAKSTALAIERGDIARVLLALDAPPELVAPVRLLAQERGLPVLDWNSSTALGAHLGVERRVAVAGERAVEAARRSA